MLQDQTIGNGNTFIIAEAGVNHNGSLATALKMVDAAHHAGANAIKFQTFKAENIVTQAASKAEYQKENTGAGGSQYEMLKKLELSYDDHIALKHHCRNVGMQFLSTPFDLESVDLLDNMGLEIYKIGSGEITNKPLLKYIGGKNKPVILSTGMSNLGEVEEAISWIREEASCDIYLLHCTSDYPAKFCDINLNAMLTLRNAFKLPVGYSDHTEGIEVPIAAVALGACIIEKHFTLDKAMEGPDHKASLNPQELKDMVHAIRNVEMAMGNGIKRVTEKELQTKECARKSIVTVKKINKGEIIKETDIAVKRPGTGIAPKYINEIIGSTALNDIEPDMLIQWPDIQIVK